MPGDTPAGKHAVAGCAPALSPSSDHRPAVKRQRRVRPCHQARFYLVHPGASRQRGLINRAARHGLWRLFSCQ